MSKDPINMLAVAIGTAKTFQCRLMATQRNEVWDGQIEAVDMEAAAREVRRMLDEWDIHPEDGIEGDEILFIEEVDEHSQPFQNDEIEIDLREEGEPFSWQACDLVKALAKAPMNLNPHLDEWIAKAQKLLENQDEYEPAAAQPAAA